MMEPKNILVIYFLPEEINKTRLAIASHIRMMEASDVRHEITYYNAWNDAPPVDLESVGKPHKPPESLLDKNFDAIILHNTFLGQRWNYWYFYIFKQHFSWIKDISGLTIAMPQDEYDHAALLDEWLFDFGVSVVFTLHERALRSLIYPLMQNRAEFVKCYPGYIDDTISESIASGLAAYHQREHDIVYRATHLPYWFGSLGQMKHRIADRVAERVREKGLRCDISTRPEDTVVGERWLDFLSSGRAVIGCESGSSVLDRYGEIQALVKAIKAQNPDISFEALDRQMPKDWDGYRFAAISPRHLEAVITKTCQILIEGDYEGVLVSDMHYIPLKRDFSNLDQALEKLGDEHLVNDMVERAYQDIYLSGKFSYGVLARKIEEVIARLGPKKIDGGNGMPNTTQTSEKEDSSDIAKDRELVALQHRKTLVQAQLMQAREQIGQQNRQISDIGELKTHLDQYDDRLQQHRDEIAAELAQSKTANQQQMDQLRQSVSDLEVFFKLRRKKALLLFGLVAAGSTVLAAVTALLIWSVLKLM